jgi:hypothetical protein
MKEVLRNEIIKLLDNGIIYPISNSKWVSPTDTIKRLMSFPKCRSVEVINNPARPGSNHMEADYINYKLQIIYIYICLIKQRVYKNFMGY